MEKITIKLTKLLDRLEEVVSPEEYKELFPEVSQLQEALENHIPIEFESKLRSNITKVVTQCWRGKRVNNPIENMSEKIYNSLLVELENYRKQTSNELSKGETTKPSLKEQSSVKQGCNCLREDYLLHFPIPYVHIEDFKIRLDNKSTSEIQVVREFYDKLELNDKPEMMISKIPKE